MPPRRPRPPPHPLSAGESSAAPRRATPPPLVTAPHGAVLVVQHADGRETVVTPGERHQLRADDLVAVRATG